MVYIALDIGIKKTGIAKSDSMGILIKPYKTILTEKLIEELITIDESLGIEKLIIGEPLNLESGNKESLENIKAKKSLIEKFLPKIKIELIDEKFTSKEAESLIKEKGIKLNKDNKELIDQYAAAIILENYWQENEKEH